MSHISAASFKTSFLRLAAGLCIAVIIPALVMAMNWNSGLLHGMMSGKTPISDYFSMLWGRFVFVYVVGAILALLFGIPAFYTLKRLLPFKLWIICLVGAIVAIIPNVFIEVFLSSEPGSQSYAFANGCVIIEDGRRTACGWHNFIINNISMVALYGAAGGAVFWLYLKKHFQKPNQIPNH